MTLKEKAATVGGYAITLVALAVMMTLVVLMIEGGVWLSKKVLPFLAGTSWITLALVLLVLSPMTIFVRTRGAASMALLICSYVFGVTLWFTGLLFSYLTWGVTAVVIGLIIFGVGVVPVAMLASIVHGEWTMLLILFALLALTIGTRVFALWAAGSADRAQEARRLYDY